MTAARELAAWLARIGVEHPRGVRRGFQHVAEVGQRLGVIPPAPTCVVVAGTNGKGSTTAFVEHLLLASGRSVGTTTSPHIHRFNERIRIDGVDAEDAAIVAAFEAVEAARCDIPLTYFEYAILAALKVIAAAGVDCAVLEVGLGGRLDAVNVVDGNVTVITSIGLDHQEFLGDTLEAIGAEKAGILRRGVPLVVGEPAPPASVLARATALDAPVHLAGREFGHGDERLWLHENGKRAAFAYRGAIDPANAATALQAARLAGWLPRQSEVQAAANAAHMPGRFETVRRRGRTWVLDVAHNPAASTFLARQLRARLPDRRISAIIGCLADKDIAGIVAPLKPLVREVAYADTDSPRGRSAVDMRAASGDATAFAGTLDAAMAHLESRRAPHHRHTNDVILVCGSFDLIERARVRLDLRRAGR